MQNTIARSIIRPEGKATLEDETFEDEFVGEVSGSGISGKCWAARNPRWTVGTWEGSEVGYPVGRKEGVSVGAIVGFAVGRNEGVSVGDNEGCPVGEAVGA